MPPTLAFSFNARRSNVPAKRLLETVRSRFQQFNFPLVEVVNVIPEDDTTLFVCSGMQNLKSRFRNPDNSRHGSIQSCIRTNDIELVGDGSHLTSFRMLGNFSFGGNDYHKSVQLWDLILKDLGIVVDSIHVHPGSQGHRELWENLGYQITLDEECVWSDGDIGGYCCEVYSRGLEIGNLVNPLGHSTDVGFGLERMLQILEGKDRVDETCLFRQEVDPVVRDHERTLSLLQQQGVKPGVKGREYVCRRLLRRMIRRMTGRMIPELLDWAEAEKSLMDKRLLGAQKTYKKHKDKPPQWWWECFGILPEEMDLLAGR